MVLQMLQPECKRCKFQKLD